MNYSRAVRVLRAVLGVSQQDMAKAVDLSPSLLSRIEAGERTLSKKNKTKISEELGLPASLLDLFAIESTESKMNESELRTIGEGIVKLSRVTNEKKTEKQI